MAKIIDELLTLARADAGKEQFSFESVNVSDFFANRSTGISRSMVAPLAIRAASKWFFVTELPDAPEAPTPPTESGP